MQSILKKYRQKYRRKVQRHHYKCIRIAKIYAQIISIGPFSHCGATILNFASNITVKVPALSEVNLTIIILYSQECLFAPNA